MEVTIKINGQALSVEVSVEVYECLDRAEHKSENLAHEKRRHWDIREFDEYIVATEGERKKKERMKLERQKRLPGGPVDICTPNDEVDKCPSILEYRDKEIRDKSIERGNAPAPLVDTRM